MSKLLSLNELYNQFIQGLLEKKEFESLIFETLLAGFARFNLYNWKRDDSIDFLSWFYPRLSKAINTYHDTGASFETYINTLVRWSAREYRARHVHRLAAEQAVWSARIPDMYVHFTEPDYLENENSHALLSKTPVKNPRQLLVLILKCYYSLSDDLIEHLAPIVGLDKEKLKEMIDSIREQRNGKDEEIRLMRERIHSQFYRCIIYEKRLKLIPEESGFFLRVKTQLEKARRRLEMMRNRLAKIRMEATNKQIAEILGLSKGTVDATLHTLKLRGSMGKDSK
jgi:DNA-directed RNA polymerase specialized sigma24 family protein